VTCTSAQERMSALLAGAVGPRERLDIEGHAGRCGRCATAYRDLVATSVALDRAYAPLRVRSASLSPARVRLALRMPQPVPASFRFSRIAARINEFGLAAAVTAFAFVGAGSVAQQPAIVDEAIAVEAVAPTHITAGPDDRYFFRWLRLDRYTPVSDVLDPAVSPKAYAAEETQPATQERSGLLR
jgi:anti-sigma factor RsiW